MTKASNTKIAELKVDVFEPRGKPKARLLFCHGAWVGGWIWEKFAAHFASAGYLCHVPTWRGHYDSRPVSDLGRISIYDYIEDALSVARSVSSDVIIGESLGGLIAMKAAESYRPRALALFNSAPPFMVPVNGTVLKKQLKYMGDLLFNRPNFPNAKDYRELILNNVPESEVPAFYSRICAESGRALREASFGKVKVDSSKIDFPVYVVAGHLDAILGPKVHQKIARKFNADLAEYPGMSHHTFDENGWEEVAAAFEKWLDDKLTNG